jgi:UDP-arabinose 4-epimerase
VPSQERLRRDDCRNFPKVATAEHLGLGCQAMALVVVQTETLVAELLSRYSILLAEVVNGVPLLLTQPAWGKVCEDCGVFGDSVTHSSVLVAGGAGYIGSHTAKLLRESGRVPVTLDNLVTGNRFALKYGPAQEGAIEDAAVVSDLIRRHDIQAAILFAAHACVGESMENPSKYFQNNVANAHAFLGSVRKSGVRSVVFSSSCSVYGVQSRIPIDEDSPVDPLSPYAESKLFLEKALKWYASAYGMRYVSLRYFNAAGADPKGEIGELHDPETHLIPLAIFAAMGKARLKVFGNDYPTPDGTPLRDYVHVTDLADAHLRALSYLENGGESTVVNLGSGVGTSVLEVIRTVEALTGRAVPYDMGSRRPGDAPVLVADYNKARRLLGWEPKLSDIRTIVETARGWHASHPG